MATGSGHGRRRWYIAIGATAGLGLLVGGLLLVLPGSTPATHTLAADCGLVNCGAAGPAPVTASSPAGVRPLPRHRPYRPVPVPRPAPLVTSTPPAGQAVTVSYSGGGHGNSGRFSTQLTIVNHGSTPISGWRLQLSYPGDQVLWVGYPGSEFVSWQFGGDTLALRAQAGGEELTPGGTQSIVVFGTGQSPVPAGCTFNGSACG
jgi:Cellulose binding domain